MDQDGPPGDPQAELPVSRDHGQRGGPRPLAGPAAGAQPGGRAARAVGGLQARRFFFGLRVAVGSEEWT